MAFKTWLCECLNAAGLDGAVYGDYISGALDSLESSSSDEVEESLLEILQGCVVGIAGRLYVAIAANGYLCNVLIPQGR